MKKLLTTNFKVTTRRPLANFTVPRHYLMAASNEENTKNVGCPIYNKENIQEIQQIHKEP